MHTLHTTLYMELNGTMVTAHSSPLVPQAYLVARAVSTAVVSLFSVVTQTGDAATVIVRESSSATAKASPREGATSSHSKASETRSSAAATSKGALSDCSTAACNGTNSTSTEEHTQHSSDNGTKELLSITFGVLAPIFGVAFILWGWHRYLESKKKSISIEAPVPKTKTAAEGTSDEKPPSEKDGMSQPHAELPAEDIPLPASPGSITNKTRSIASHNALSTCDTIAELPGDSPISSRSQQTYVPYRPECSYPY
jgi:hypothetical protein